MAETRICGKCGVMLSPYAPPGLCANCMLQQGFDPALVASALSEEGPPSASHPNASSPPRTGIRSFGDYELVEEIARGGMGIIYRAHQVSLNRQVAVKMLLLGPLSSPELVKRFRAEASAAAGLQHPNIVAIHEVGVHQGLQYFAMDFVEGQSLAKVLAGGPLSPTRAAGYLKIIAEAVHYAHERGLLHRDLKPSNVLIDTADQPRVTDFGLAKRLEGDSELTLTGQVLGSPNYMPPEQAGAKRGHLSRRSDVYSLGSMLYHLVTGRPPFVGETIPDTLSQVINSDPVSLGLLNPSVSRDLETICLKCLEKEPAKRYPTARALADELSRFLCHEPIQARPVSPLEKLWRYCRRKPALAGLSLATALLLLTLGIVSPIAAFRINRERQRADQSLYDADMSLAQRDWDAGDLGGTLKRLQTHQPHAGEKDRRGFEWFYYSNLCTSDAHLTLTGHHEPVSSVAFSADGKVLATGSAGDRDSVRIWDSATGTLLKTLPKQDALSLAFSPDSRMLGVGGRDHLAVWNLVTGQAVFQRAEIAGRFRVAFPTLGGTLVVIGRHGSELGMNDDGSAELWDYAANERKRSFPDSGGYVTLSSQGDRLATGNAHDAVTVRDLASGIVVSRMARAYAIALAFSPDGRTLATSDWRSVVKMWSVSTGEQIASRTNDGHRVWSLAFSPDGKVLATGSTDQTVSLWDVSTGHRMDRLQGHGSEVLSVAFSSDGRTLASGSRDKTAMIWDVGSVRTHRAVAALSAIRTPPVFSTNSQLLAAGIGQNKVGVWNSATLQSVAILPDAHDAVAFSPDGRTLITRGTNYFLRSFDVATQVALNTIQGRPADTNDSWVALSGQSLLVGLGSSRVDLQACKLEYSIVSPK